MMKVAVVGSGVVGLCVAEALQRRGADVVVLEKDHCGGGASSGNAGWITPGLSGPMPAPGSLVHALGWVVNRNSPLSFRPAARLSFLRWSYAFWRSMSFQRHRATRAALVALSDRTLESYDALAERGVKFEMHADGLLFVALTKKALAAEHGELRAQRDLGYSGDIQILGRDEAVALEPSLGDRVAGAILAADERHVRPESVIGGLTDHLRRAGVEIREASPVTRIWREAGRWSLACGGVKHDFAADAVVVSAGIGTRGLLESVGVHLPLEGAKGYSVTDHRPSVRLSRPVYMLEPRVAVSPFDDGLRLAGTFELGTSSLDLEHRRLRLLDRAGRVYLRDWRPAPTHQRWAGFRPMLPDGMPAIGGLPGLPGLFVATGHGMLGVTLAPTTAEVLAPAVLEGRNSPELVPFSVTRFDGKPRRAARMSNPARPHGGQRKAEV